MIRWTAFALSQEERSTDLRTIALFPAVVTFFTRLGQREHDGIDFEAFV